MNKRQKIDNMIKKLERDLNTKQLIIELTQRNLNRFQSEYEHIYRDWETDRKSVV